LENLDVLGRMSAIPDFRSSSALRIAYRRRRVLVTGHTGFTGGWITLWLKELGAQVIGLSLEPDSTPNLFDDAQVDDGITHLIGDIRRSDLVHDIVMEYRPEIVLHLAAQPLVFAGYADPLTTFGTNVMGTAHVLEACRRVPSVRACVVVTSDKAYAPSDHPHREDDPIGGNDPYSASKGATELVTAAYRNSYFSGGRGFGLATARAGNVIGGGDWSADRIVPDWLRSRVAGVPLTLRHPDAIRPWQHVLEPAHAYLMLGAALLVSPREYSEGWNFGPDNGVTATTVQHLIDQLDVAWGSSDPTAPRLVANDARAETLRLTLDPTKSAQRFGWRTLLTTQETAQWTSDWYRQHQDDHSKARELTLRQIADYEQRIDSSIYAPTTSRNVERPTAQ
jgi:CDP-glucose 4,6-dehydratase